MTETLITGLHIYHGFLSGYRNIASHREYINEINVFPVPDGDTGNNMVKTMKSIVNGMDSSRSAGNVMEKIADLSLEGARGNSGIILSQYLNGLAKKIGLKRSFSMRDFGRAVKESVDDAYLAMEDPREGTILTVIKIWAETIYKESLGRISLNEVFTRGFKAARKALSKTPDQMQVLKDNNVVDAGAWGFVSFLEGIEKMEEQGLVPFHFRRQLGENISSIKEASSEKTHNLSKTVEFRYCTEVLLEKTRTDSLKLKKKLRAFGDSLIISQGKNKTRIHIHTNTPDQVVKVLRRYGVVSQQKVDDMFRQEQVVNHRAGKIGILTDSIADIPRDILDEYQIHVINLNLLWDEEEFLDRLTISPEEFYRQQQTRKSFPSSSVPDRNRIDTLLQYLMSHYEGLLVLPVAKRLSGTWQQLSLAAEEYNKESKRIRVIDTCLNSAAQGLLVVEAAKKAARGESLDNLESFVENLKQKVKIYVSVNTFKFMVKGGRVSALKGILASLLNLKPIISLDETGKGIAFDKAFSRKGLEKKIAKLVGATNQEKGIERYCIVHGDSLEKARIFGRIVEGITGKPPEYISSISPIVGMHSGKGAIAIGLIEES